MFRLVVFADTHLRDGHGRFQRNFSRAVRKAGRFDLAIIAGDLSVDGADHRRDLEAAKARFQALKHPWRAIPGNHDLGTEAGTPGARQPVTPERRQRYLDVFGEDFWAEDVPGWRLVGLNVHMFGTGWAEDARQWDMLENAVATRGDRRLGVFIHKPLFLQRADEDEDLVNCTTVEGRKRLLALADDGKAIAFFASGHHHQGRVLTDAGVHHIWSPATANAANNLRAADVTRNTGFTVFELFPEARFRAHFDVF